MDGNEFKSRFLPFTKLIYKVSFAITRDKEDAEDIVQEVFEKLWKSRDSLSSVLNDEGYIITVARNLALDRYRSKTKRIILPFAEVSEIYEDGFIDSKIEQKEKLINVEKLICTLPQSQQTVIRLRHFGDLSIFQIAETMELTQENVRQLLSRGRRTIKEKIEKIYEN
ncbi:MAG: RNA polymerase sigma factor [Fermentimonas sp.]|nr:RNA polymerase sigma factor [Fermentimonas sp.]